MLSDTSKTLISQFTMQCCSK